MSLEDQATSGAQAHAGKAPLPESYFAQAASWADDRTAHETRSRRIAWIVAAIASAIALLEALALIALLPLKTIIPYTLLVDRTTGHVQLLKGTHPETITPGSALTQSLLSQYVIARESFDRATIADQYRRVALWSDETARRDYLALMPASNPASPFNQLPGRATLSTRVESVSVLGPQTALVRFTTRRGEAQSGNAVLVYWVAVIRYRYAGAPQALEDRLVNPLGFKVISYRRDQEAPPASTAVTPATALIRPSDLMAGMALLASVGLRADVLPQPGPGDPRLQTVFYDPEQVVTLQVASGYALTLLFSPDERIETVTLGDPSSWSVQAPRRADQLVIKTRGYAPSTNLVVTTDSRRYSFSLVNMSGSDASAPYVVRFTYPPPSLAVQTEPQTIDSRYRFAGDRALWPSSIRDDGIRTSIIWSADTALPATYRAVGIGKAALVNGRMEGSAYVIEGVHRKLLFRRGDAQASATRETPRRQGKR